MESLVREKIIFVYGVAIAFLLGILGGVIANEITPTVFHSKFNFLTVTIIILSLIYYLITDVTKRLGIRKPVRRLETSIEYPYEIARAFYKRFRWSYDITFVNAKMLNKSLCTLVKYLPAILLIIYIPVYFSLNFLFESLCVFLITTSPIVLLRIIGNKFQYCMDLQIFKLARKTDSCFSFLIEGRGFLDPREYRLIFDFNESIYFFTCYEPNEDLEKQIVSELDEIITEKKRNYKKKEVEKLLKTLELSHNYFKRGL